MMIAACSRYYKEASRRESSIETGVGTGEGKQDKPKQLKVHTVRWTCSSYPQTDLIAAMP